jgi:hypothetical protein
MAKVSAEMPVPVMSAYADWREQQGGTTGILSSLIGERIFCFVAVDREW